jgi:hypothetical protein
MEHESPLEDVQNKNTYFYLNIVKPKLDAISSNISIESVLDIDILCQLQSVTKRWPIH